MGDKKEYIERGALIAEYDRVHVGAPGGARKLMVDAPAADVVEVRHGEWVVTGTERAWNNSEYPIERTCSVCGMRRNIETQVAWNFCPNCGARMDVERKEL